MVECPNYDRQRRELVAGVVSEIGREEWARRVEEDKGAICTVLGLYGDSKRSEKRIVHLMKAFLTQSWDQRTQNSE